MKRVAFHANHLGIRGVEVSLYDYALHNETLLGNQSIIISNANSPFNHPEGIQKFGARFPVFLYQTIEEIEPLLEAQQIDTLYCQKAGVWDGILARCCPTVVHCVFKDKEPHGTVYAYISEWLSRTMGGGEFPWVPYMLSLPKSEENFRGRLGIPPDALVFGRHGGAETFDIPFVHDTVRRVAERYPQIYFLFLNTHPFAPRTRNIIHLRPTTDIRTKVGFINTCDAMLHGRIQGETFGLAVGEFSACNKPVITWSGSDERCHIELLGECGISYSTARELEEILTAFRPDTSRNWDCYSERFAPEVVMRQFDRVFLTRTG